MSRLGSICVTPGAPALPSNRVLADTTINEFGEDKWEYGK